MRRHSSQEYILLAHLLPWTHIHSVSHQVYRMCLGYDKVLLYVSTFTATVTHHID